MSSVTLETIPTEEQLDKAFEHGHFFNGYIRLQRVKKRQKKSNVLLKRLVALVDTIIGEGPALSTELEKITKEAKKRSKLFANSLSLGMPFSSASSSSWDLHSPTEEALSSISDLEIQKFSSQFEMPSTSRQSKRDETANQQYPQQDNDVVILGPNGTEVDLRSYTSIIWSSAASATRQLLGFVFTSDILATHTLTGKPSPAFYGRERPPKMQLDPIKAADIIHCVRSKFNCSEREIRAAITTKCSDTSKKYKRRLQKQTEGN